MPRSLRITWSVVVRSANECTMVSSIGSPHFSEMKSQMRPA